MKKINMIISIRNCAINIQKKWYRDVIKYIFGCRRVEKKIKLNVFLMSDNNSNILAPILGQYGIKPSDFITRLKDTFISTNKLSNIDVLLIHLVFSFIVYIGKNNAYRFVFKKFNYSFLYNTFLTRKKGIYLQVLFLYKLQCLKSMPKSLFFLFKKILKLRFLFLLIFFYLIFFDFDFLTWKDIVYNSVVYSNNIINEGSCFIFFNDYNSFFSFRNFLSLSNLFVEVWKYAPLYEYFNSDDVSFISDTFDYEEWAKYEKFFHRGFYYRWEDYIDVILNPYKQKYLDSHNGEVLDNASAFAFFNNQYSFWVYAEHEFLIEKVIDREDIFKQYGGEKYKCLNDLDTIFYHLDEHFKFFKGAYVNLDIASREGVVMDAVKKVCNMEGDYIGNKFNFLIKLKKNVSVVQHSIKAILSMKGA